MIDAQQRAKLLRYEALKFEAKKLDAEIDELKAELIAVVPEDTEVALEHGTIVRNPGRIEWKYSVALTEKIKAVDAAKKEEQQTGDARAVYGQPYLVYRENK